MKIIGIDVASKKFFTKYKDSNSALLPSIKYSPFSYLYDKDQIKIIMKFKYLPKSKGKNKKKFSYISLSLKSESKL